MKTWKSKEKAVLFAETDASTWVHNSHFMRYVENAEHELFRELGVKPVSVGSGWPRAHFEIDFRSPMIFDTPYHIELSILRLGNTSIRWSFKIISKELLIAEGNMVSVQVNEKGWPLEMNSEFKEKLKEIFEL